MTNGKAVNKMKALLKKLIQELLGKISPDVRDLIKKSLVDWKQKAAITENWYDDVAVDFLIDIFGFTDI
jgi:hypothetical protein